LAVYAAESASIVHGNSAGAALVGGAFVAVGAGCAVVVVVGSAVVVVSPD
jgi:hypothetical protein